MIALVLLCLIVPVAMLVFAIVASDAPSKPSRLFHKWKIVKVTHSDGMVDYTVKINGFLGMPFLYQTMVEDMGLYCCEMKKMSLKNAEEYVEKKNAEFSKNRAYKRIINKTTFLPERNRIDNEPFLLDE